MVACIVTVVVQRSPSPHVDSVGFLSFGKRKNKEQFRAQGLGRHWKYSHTPQFQREGRLMPYFQMHKPLIVAEYCSPVPGPVCVSLRTAESTGQSKELCSLWVWGAAPTSRGCLWGFEALSTRLYSHFSIYLSLRSKKKKKKLTDLLLHLRHSFLISFLTMQSHAVW